MVALIKPNEIEKLIKTGVFLIQQGILISGMSAMDKWEKGGTAQEVHETFL
jgi:hypothetical protein